MIEESRALLILCNSRKWLKGMIDFFPYKELAPFDILIVYEDKIGTTRKELEDILLVCDNVNFKEARVIDPVDVREHYHNLLGPMLTPDGHDFIEDYTMGMNILGHHYVLDALGYNKVFFCDDDIFFVRPFHEIFDFYSNVHHKDGFSPFRHGNHTPGGKVTQELMAMFDLTKPVDEMNKLKIQGGHRLWPDTYDNCVMYPTFLAKFFNSKLLAEYWPKYLVKERGYKSCMWLIDQHFEACYIHWLKDHNPEAVTIKTLANIVYGKGWGKLSRRPKSYMYHYANGTHKDRFYEDFYQKAPLWKN